MSRTEERDRVESRVTPRRRHFRLNAAWIAIALIVILSVAQLVGALIHNLNQTRMGAIFAIGVVSFLGMLSLGHQGERYRAIESSEVRTALAASFAMVFFAAVAIFLFSVKEVGDFGRSLMDNLTSLFGVVIGFYFASSAVVDFAKTRREKDSDRPGSNPDPGQAALAGRVKELEQLVAELQDSAPPSDGHAKRVRAGEPTPSPAND